MPQPTLLHQHSQITPEQAGRYIQSRRKALGISQSVMAEKLGVQRNYISYLETGRYDIRFNAQRLQIIAQLLGLTDQELWENLGVRPVGYAKDEAARFLGRLEGFHPELPVGLPTFLPDWLKGDHRPQDLLIIELDEGGFGIFDKTATRGALALEYSPAHGYRIMKRPTGQVVAYLVGTYTPL